MKWVTRERVKVDRVACPSLTIAVSVLLTTESPNFRLTALNVLRR